MSRLTDSETKILRNVVNAQKQNRRATPGLFIVVTRQAETHAVVSSMIQKGFLLESERLGGHLVATGAGIAALAENDAVELTEKFERALDRSNPDFAISQLGTVVFELAKRVGILEATCG